mgnify:CR=1 FL=1
MSKVIPLAYPILLFLDGYFVHPYGSFKATGDVYLGLATFFMFLIIFIMFKSTRYFSRHMVLLYILLLVPILSSPKSLLYCTSYFLHILFAFLVLNRYKENDLTRLLYRLLLTYIIISVVVYLQRGLNYNWNFLRLRGGFNIWGGSPLLGTILLFRIVSLIQGKFDDYKHLDWLFVVLSLAYISRSGIFLSAIYIISRIKLRRAYMFILPLVFWRNISGGLLHDLGQLISMRMGSDDVLGERSLLWKQIPNILFEQPLGVGYAGFQSYSDYSSAHNLTLNIVLEFGLIFGLVFIVYICYLVVVAISNCKVNKKLLILYLMAFFVISHTSGFKIIQTNGYISAIQLWFLFAMIPLQKSGEVL